VRTLRNGGAGGRGTSRGNGGPHARGETQCSENPATAARFRVQSIPTLLLLKGGRELDRIVGVQSKAAILQRLERVAA